MKTILVTGGAGFIGSNLCNKLLEEGHKVICLDNLSTGRWENVCQWYSHPRFYFCKADVLEDNLVQKAMCYGPTMKFLVDFRVDEIYHLASPASPPKYQEDPIKTFRTNTEGTHQILNLARRWGAKVLYASTSEIYGDPDVHPQNEEYRGNVNTIGPRSCYDEGKRGGETLCSDHYRAYGTKIVIARIFNTYGPNMDPKDGRVVSNMICQYLKNEPMTIYGSGDQTRSFCYVDDLVKGLIKLMDSNCFVMPINLGNPDEFTINSLACLISRTWAPKIIYKELPIDDPKKRKPDITLAKNLLNWSPQVSLEEGLIKTIPYFQEQLKNVVNKI